MMDVEQMSQFNKKEGVEKEDTAGGCEKVKQKAIEAPVAHGITKTGK